jgi:hypothetical protein
MSNNNQRVKRHYVYGHYTNEDVLFYIGVGTITNLKTDKIISRYTRAYHKSNRTKFWNSIVSKHGLKVKILFEYYTKEESLKKEAELVEKFGRRCMNNGILCNISSGGQIGPIGRRFKMEDAQKRKLSEIKSQEFYIYNSVGVYLLSLKTLKNVAKYCEVTPNAISSCLKTKNYSNGYFIFREYQGEKLNYSSEDLNFKSVLSKKVVTISEEGVRIVHDSVYNASKFLNTDRKNLKRGINNNRLVKKHRVFFEGSISSQDL